MDFLPALSPELQAFIRVSYGSLLLCTIAWTWLPGKWFFRGAKWRGYGDRRWSTELLQNPFSHTLIRGLWVVSALGLVLGQNTVSAAFVNLVICWYYFIHTRWSSLLRGMGAPGFFCYWLGAATFFLELGRHLDPSGRILAVAVLVFQMDYALIQLCAGSYKSVCGYSRNAGMQLGLANPFWGHHWRFYKRMSPDHRLFKFLNQAAFRVQIVSALLMLFPPTRVLGAFFIAAGFLFVMTQIRLGFLLPKVMLGALLFIPSGSAIDRIFQTLVTAAPVRQSLPLLGESATFAVCGFLLLYLALLPLAKFCQWFNFLEGKSLHPILQSSLDTWSNFFGIIIWRVFSVDVVNFFVRIYVVEPDNSECEYTSFGSWFGPGTRGRYVQVAESIALTSVFTTLKYHPSNSELFTEKLTRYARSVPVPPGGTVRFALYFVDHSGESFEFIRSNDYLVDPATGTVRTSAAHSLENSNFSPVRAGAKAGSYLPVLPV